ncbi:MAG: hypothetical protein QF824_03690 [Candidatus Woesearchaeota archaeon]|jgi:hypothetical protein|nr:hypothetical protein [Candidatus Woesearchaeota archaeon]|tara:strand:+ start:571 stop:1212 length:642 start_codon:yes stop_codon:yes gene_type:complete
MTKEIPKYCLRAYGLLYTKYGTMEEFTQDKMNWIVSSSMKKKIFSVLLNSEWIKKKSRRSYVCIGPKTIFTSLFSFKVPDILKKAEKKYCYTQMSSVEIWTDFSYIQRSWEHSPYFIKIEESDIDYWKQFLSKQGIPFFIGQGSFIGEFIILEPKKGLKCSTYKGFLVDTLDTVVKFCQNKSLFEYSLAYLKQKFNLKIKINPELLEKVKEAL